MNLTFFSFVTMPGATPEEHAAYNRWHQLDHRPENLALPGVAWGDRWARPEGYRDYGAASPTHCDTDYVAMYWFRDPAKAALKEWNQLAEDSFQWGRGPLIPGVQRRLLAFFRPQRGYAAPRVLVNPEVLVRRPNRGLHLTLTRHPEHHGRATHDHYAWEDRRLIPDLLEVDGVAGAWTFSFVRHQQHPTMPFGAETGDEPGSLRIRLLYLDGDPATCVQAIEQVESEAHGDVNSQHEVLLSTPLRTIVPWQDW